MKILSTYHSLSILLLSILLGSCQLEPPTSEPHEQVLADEKDSTDNQQEKEIIDFVENLLKAAGNYHVDELDTLTSDKSVIGYTRKKDGIWKNTELTMNEYVENFKTRELRPYIEIVSDYDIIVTDDHMALVRADAVVNRFGIPGLREVNHMVLIKENEQWKLLTIGWTVNEQTDKLRKFDLDIFAKNYAQVWASQRPAFVAMFYEEDGILQVNDGEPAIGRTAISNVAQSFMTKFPDMNVRFDSLAYKSNGIEFHWTLTGTDSDPNGKGHKVEFSGFELWTMSEANLIKVSKGSFSSEEYNRQLEFGIEE